MVCKLTQVRDFRGSRKFNESDPGNCILETPVELWFLNCLKTYTHDLKVISLRSCLC